MIFWSNKELTCHLCNLGEEQFYIVLIRQLLGSIFVMDPQLQLFLPIPIIEEIIYCSRLKDKLSFRQSCKLLFRSTSKRFFTTITKTLCGSTSGYEDGEALTA